MAKRWYIVHAHSNFEKKVVANIHEQARLNGLDGLIEEVLVPTEQITKTKPGGKKVSAEKLFFPGYILLKADLTDELYHTIKGINKVTGFLGSNKKPKPISDAEAQRILRQVDEGAVEKEVSIRFEIGEEVNVIDGPFASFKGLIEEVDEVKNRLKVAVAIFGRPTPVELEYGQVSKI